MMTTYGSHREKKGAELKNSDLLKKRSNESLPTLGTDSGGFSDSSVAAAASGSHREKKEQRLNSDLLKYSLNESSLTLGMGLGGFGDLVCGGSGEWVSSEVGVWATCADDGGGSWQILSRCDFRRCDRRDGGGRTAATVRLLLIGYKRQDFCLWREVRLSVTDCTIHLLIGLSKLGSISRNLTNWSDLSDRGGGAGFEKLPFQEAIGFSRKLQDLLRRRLPDQEGIKKKGGGMEGRINTLDRWASEHKRELAEWRTNIQEIKEMLQKSKNHINGSEKSKKIVRKGKKEGETDRGVVEDSLLDIKKAKKLSDEEEMEEDRGAQNWRQQVELARFEGLDPLGWISQVEKLFDTPKCHREGEAQGGTIYWFRAWKNKTKNLSWKGLKEALIMGFAGRDRGSVLEKKRETEVAVLSVDGFARIKGQDRREENICGEEGNDENCDGDMGVTAAGKVEKAVVFTAADKVAKVVVFTAAEKVAKAAIFTAAQEVAKNIVSREDSGVGGDVYVKTVEKGEDRVKKAEHGGNMVAIMAGNKVEDAADLSGEKIWLSQTYKTPEDQWQGYFFAGLHYNIQRKQLAQHDDDEGIGWSDQQVLSFLASRMNKSGQGEGFARTAAIKIQKSGHQVRRQYRTIIWSMGILEKKQLLKESTILSYRPPPKPPDLNWRAAASGFGFPPMMRMSHGNKHYCTNLEGKVVLQQGVMIGYKVIGYNGFKKGGQLGGKSCLALS
ncbi:hypothetical protein V8G54_010446 [Vigna mungo]|uniref:Uncharacterized protein n=1 Tax=Vigna mungo TaxID=3915 RepID=A0AAQ3S6G5_VIGMU